MNQVGRKGKGKSKKSKGQSKGKGSCQNQNQIGKGKSKGQSKGKTKSKGKKINGPSGQVNLGHGIKIKVKVGKEKARDIKYVLQSINAGGLRKLVLQELVQIIRGRFTISQLNLGIILSQSRPQISSGDFKISDLFKNNTSQSTILLSTFFIISGVLSLCLWPRSRIQWSSASSQSLHIRCHGRLHHGGQRHQSPL